MLIIAPNERQVRIEVGYGLEGVLTDAVSSVVLNNMAPDLTKNNYNQVALIGVQQILNVIKGETFSHASQNKEDPTAISLFLTCLVLGLFIYVGMAPKNDRARRLCLVLTILSFVPGKSGGFKGKGGRFGGGGSSRKLKKKLKINVINLYIN